jgi:hypothetical protein
MIMSKNIQNVQIIEMSQFRNNMIEIINSFKLNKKNGYEEISNILFQKVCADKEDKDMILKIIAQKSK